MIFLWLAEWTDDERITAVYKMKENILNF